MSRDSHYCRECMGRCELVNAAYEEGRQAGIEGRGVADVAFTAYNQAIEDAKLAIRGEKVDDPYAAATFINAIARKCSPHVYVNRLATTSLRSEVVEAITDMQEGRESHQQWFDHLSNPERKDCQGCEDHAVHIGDAQHHRGWIDKYDRVIRLLALVPIATTPTADGERCAESSPRCVPCGHVGGDGKDANGEELCVDPSCQCKCVFPAPPEAEDESKKPVRDDLLQPVSNNPKPWRLRLYDRADGIKGHYCVGRWNPAGYHEFWNDDQFCSAGEVFIGEQAALSKAIDLACNESVWPAATPVPAVQDDECEHGTQRGIACTFCDDLDNGSTATNSAAVEAARLAAREIFRYLETARPHPTSPEWNSVNVTATGKTVLEDAVVAIISHHFPPTEEGDL